MFYAYILRSTADGTYYIGSCEDLVKRIDDHNKNKTRSIKNKGPFELVHKESFGTRSEAVQRERQIKRYKGGRFFKKLIAASPSSSLA